MVICRCQSGHPANTTLHTILKQSRITPVISVDENINRPECNNDRCDLLLAVTNCAGLREDAPETLVAKRVHWLFVCHRMMRGLWFCGRPTTLTSPAFGQGLVFFSVWLLQKKIGSARSVMLPRVRLAIIWLRAWNVVHSNVILSKHCPTSSHTSQHRMLALRCRLRYARIAVAATSNWAPWVVGLARNR